MKNEIERRTAKKKKKNEDNKFDLHLTKSETILMLVSVLFYRCFDFFYKWVLLIYRMRLDFDEIRF